MTRASRPARIARSVFDRAPFVRAWPRSGKNWPRNARFRWAFP